LRLALLSLAAAVLFIGGLGLLPFDPVEGRAIRAQASQQAARIVNAIKLFESQYSALPIPAPHGEHKIPTDSAFIDILTGADADHNPKATAFLEGKQAKRPSGNKPPRSGFIDLGKGSSSLVDPWGNFYMVIMDANDDGEIEVPGAPNPVRAKAVCWSYGKPKNRNDYRSALENDPKEWIASWR
jgi:hypothetical protein